MLLTRAFNYWLKLKVFCNFCVLQSNGSWKWTSGYYTILIKKIYKCKLAVFDVAVENLVPSGVVKVLILSLSCVRHLFDLVLALANFYRLQDILYLFRICLTQYPVFNWFAFNFGFQLMSHVSTILQSGCTTEYWCRKLRKLRRIKLWSQSPEVESLSSR